MAFPLTDEQKKIVDDRGGELLVSAAAGSGKTRVLVERLLDRVTREGLDLDRFLVITYTKAAAAELRTRIAQELSSRLAENPGDRHLRRQSTLVYRAQISTIHSFCSALLREEGHRLDLDPDFRLCDEGEAQVLMAQVLEDVLEAQYEGIKPDSPFAVLVDTLSAGRDDSRLAQIVLDVFGRIQSHPHPERWLREQREVWELSGVTDAGETAWGRLLLTDAARQGRDCAKRLEEALALTAADELLEGNYAPSLQATLEGVEAFCAAAEGGSWDRAFACLPIPFPAVGRKRKRTMELSPMEEARALAATQRVKDLRNAVKERFGKLSDWFDGDSGEQLAALGESRPAVQGLMDLVGTFQGAYQTEKARRGLLDFSDLEHFAVRLLTDPETGEPTQLARSWSARYAEVMVDEYQDTNQVQNAIFSAVSDGGRKLFQVGDVKQSIYRFRLADPTIFLGKYRSFPDGDEAAEGEPRRRVLSRNFRSRRQVLEGCNDLFRNIMSTEFGELDYTDDQALVPEGRFPESEHKELELDLLDLSFLGDQEEGEREDKNRLEARWAARRIRALLDQPLMVKEGDGERPLRPSDVMILLRSPGVVMHHYLRELSQAGVPWRADSGGDFFETTEVNVALALLQIVDNPRQDVPLIAALRSPLYGFDGDKLALLRAGSKSGDFYSAVVRAAQEGDGECRDFLEELEELRFGAGDMTCRQLIWHIYEKTNLLGLFGAMPGGQERQDNLLSLYALAGELEDSGCRSLFQFLLRLERIRAAGGKVLRCLLRPGGGGGVHPVHPPLQGAGVPGGAGVRPVPPLQPGRPHAPGAVPRPAGGGPQGAGPGADGGVPHPGPAGGGPAAGAGDDGRGAAPAVRGHDPGPGEADFVHRPHRGAQGPGAAGGGGGRPGVPGGPGAAAERGGLDSSPRPHPAGGGGAAGHVRRPGADCAQGLGPAWDIRWVEGAGLRAASQPEGRFADLPAAEQDGEAGELMEALTWRYPYGAASEMPSKLTATQLKGRVLDQEAAEETPKPREHRPEPIQRPDFIAREKGLTPTERGTALHLAMQYLPLDGRPQPGGDRGGSWTAWRRGGSSPTSSGRRWTRRCRRPSSPPTWGKRLLASPEIHREFKFSLLAPASDYGPGLEGEEVLLQGVIDCWFAEGDGLTVLDFKSDRIRPGGEGTRAEEYRPQLEAYSRALERVTGRKVFRRVLWFFATGQPWEL